MEYNGLPEKQGMYDPQFEHDACGIGFIANIKGKTSHKIINQAIQILKNLAHRGGVGSEPDTGDGAGILIQLPHAFFKKVCRNEDIDLPEKGDYGVGMLFLSPDADTRSESVKTLAEIIEGEGQKLLGVRERAKNLEGCFFVTDRKAVKGKRILLVDDTLTTGATLSELAGRLKRAGASKVYALTFTGVENKFPFGKPPAPRK